MTGNDLAAPRIGVTAFASLIGVSQPAVTHAVKAGRLPSVERDATGRVWIVDVEQAKREWAENARPRAGGRRGKGARPANGETVATTLVDAQRRVAIQRERKLKFENVLKRGQYLRMSDVKREAFESARVIREGLLNLPARLSSQLAAESDAAAVFTLLDTEIRAALTSVAEALEMEVET